jgi:hypothetical protein
MQHNPDDYHLHIRVIERSAENPIYRFSSCTQGTWWLASSRAEKLKKPPFIQAMISWLIETCVPNEANRYSAF